VSAHSHRFDNLDANARGSAQAGNFDAPEARADARGENPGEHMLHQAQALMREESHKGILGGAHDKKHDPKSLDCGADGYVNDILNGKTQEHHGASRHAGEHAEHAAKRDQASEKEKRNPDAFAELRGQMQNIFSRMHNIPASATAAERSAIIAEAGAAARSIGIEGMGARGQDVLHKVQDLVVPVGNSKYVRSREDGSGLA
jgi:hypothetical protein